MHRLIVLSLIAFFIAAITRPRTARCPTGLWLDEGVRADGTFECAPLPPARWVRGPRGGAVDASPDGGPAIAGHVYCTGGSRAITVDGVTVGCQAVH